MKRLLIILLLLTSFGKTSFAQTGFSFDSIANPPYICQAHVFNVEIFGMRADGSTQNGSQNYFISNDTIYAQFHFVGGVGPAVPTPLYRSITIPAPFNFGRYKIVAQGLANGQVLQTLTSAISICSGVSAAPEEISSPAQLTVFPNPTADELKIAIPDNKNGLKITLSDATGKTVRAKKLAAGAQLTHLNLKKLPAGIYLLQVTDAERNFSQKIIKH